MAYVAFRTGKRREAGCTEADEVASTPGLKTVSGCYAQGVSGSCTVQAVVGRAGEEVEMGSWAGGVTRG